MNVSPDRFAPPPDWRDPRLAADFDPAMLPACDGGEPPPLNAESMVDRRKLEFLASYYEINSAYARFEAASERERPAALALVDAALTARDKMEDRYSPIGFYGEPQMKGARTMNLIFMHAAQLQSPQPALSSLSVELPTLCHLPGNAPSRKLDTAGLIRFLEQQIPPRNGKTDP